MKRSRMPNLIKFDEGLAIKRLYPNKDSKLFNEFVDVYNNNYEHLRYWHRYISSLSFKNYNDYIFYLKASGLMCYTIILSGKIIGCIEVGYIEKDFANLKFRTLSYWIDKNQTRKGYMSKVLKSLENYFDILNLDYILADICNKNEPSKLLLDKFNYKKMYYYGPFFSHEECGYIRYRKNLSNKCYKENFTVYLNELIAA